VGCGCGGTKKQAQQYVYTDPKGNQTTYQTEVQARASQIRNGGGTYVVMAAR
jgi:hypothetical protein